MSVDRLTRINELLRREIAECLFRIMTEASFDLSAVTITRVQTSRSLRSARVMVSILGHENERQDLLNMLRRHRAEIQARINTDLVMKYTPRLSFVLDTSVEQGDHILDVLAELERDEAADPTDEQP
jgi:ribosome-binding factor A